MTLYPLVFKPIYIDKVWGGRTLEKLGRVLPGDGSRGIGESWELADLAATDGSGGGGAARSVVRDGPLAGRTLHELITAYGEQLIGSAPLTESGGFPLLIKYLDARENLSVQVHPSAAYAGAHPEAHLKSEAWYIVYAEPAAAIYKGVHDGVTADQFREAIENDTVEQLMIRVPIEAGQCHYLPSGTCHALGAGVVVAEVQTPSDTTFRVYDWGRTGRALHIEQAMQCIDFHPARTEQYEPNTIIHRQGHIVETLVQCEHFRIEKVYIETAQQMPIVTNHEPRVWMVLEGGGRITCGGETISFSRGDTLLHPAEMDDPQADFDAATTFLKVTIPSQTGQMIA